MIYLILSIVMNILIINIFNKVIFSLLLLNKNYKKVFFIRLKLNFLLEIEISMNARKMNLIF